MNKRAKPTWIFYYALLIGAFVFSITTPAIAGTVTNKTTGTSYSTLEVALTAAGTGDVLLAEGLFNEYNVKWSKYNNITLKASTETSVATIDANWLGRGITVESVVNLNIEGMTITRGRLPSGGNGGGIVLAGGSTLNLTKVIIKYCSAEISYTGGAIFAGNISTTINANNCWFVGNKANAGGVVYNGIWNTTNSVYVKNTATGNGGVAYNVTWTSTNCAYSYNNVPNGGSFGGVWYFCKLVELNDIIWGNTAGGGDPVWSNMNPSDPFLMRYCNIQTNTGSFSWPVQTDNISFEPRLASTVETASNFMRLATGSRLIDAGSMESGVPTMDAAGNKRPRSTLADIGAYEFIGPSVKLLSPIGRESYYVKSKVNITWTCTDEKGLRTSPEPMLVRYSTNEGASWSIIGTFEGNDGLLTWETPALATIKYLISIEATNVSGESNYDVSLGTFEVKYRPIMYVSPSGNDVTGDGTNALPLRTIQLGLNCTAASGEVRLIPGPYTTLECGPYVNSAFVNWPNRGNITLHTSPDATGLVTIDVQSQGRWLTINSNVSFTLEGFTIKNSRISTGHGGAMWLDAGFTTAKLTLLDMNFISNEARGVSLYVGGAIAIASNSMGVLKAVNTKFIGNMCEHIGGAIFGQQNGQYIFNNCVFSGNHARNNAGAIFAGTINANNTIFYNNYSDVGNGGVSDSANGASVFVNCSFLNNRAAGTGGVENNAYAGGSWTLKNCIVEGNTAPTGPVFNLTLNVIGKYSYIQSNGWTVPSGSFSQTKCISTELDLVSTVEGATGFLVLGPGSQCIDGATLESDVPTRDASGAVRPRNTLVDIGVYEYLGPSIKVYSPNSGEAFNYGPSIPITWRATDEPSTVQSNQVNIRYTRNGGKNWNDISLGETNDGSYSWNNPPYVASDKYLISIDATSANPGNMWNYDVSDAPFYLLLPVVYVSPNGSDETGTGTYEAPFRTIQKGLNTVAASGEVRLFPGRYTTLECGPLANGSFINWPNRANINLRISPEATGLVTIDAQRQGRVIRVNNNVSISLEGITIMNGYVNDYAAAVYLTATDTTGRLDLRSMKFVSNEAGPGAYNGGAISASTTNICSATNCQFITNKAANYGGAVQGGTWTLNNCVLSRNSAPSVSAQGGAIYGGVWTAYNTIFNNNYSGAHGGVLAYTNGTTFVNCDFISNNAVSHSGIINYDTVGLTIKNCIVYGNTGPMAAAFSNVVVTSKNSNVQSNAWTSVNAGYTSSFNPTNCTSKEPLLISSIEGTPNYLALGFGSACIDLGTMESNVPTRDVAGLSRPRGFAPDAGVYEYYGPSIKVTAPNTGESYNMGAPIPIRWVSTNEYGIAGTVNIRYSKDSGKIWSTVSLGETNDGAYDWASYPSIAANTYLISIEVANTSSEAKWNCDTSDSNFSLLSNVIYVSTLGSDEAGTGAYALPFKTIQKGLICVTPTGEVRLQPGVYTLEAAQFVNTAMINWPNKTNIKLCGSPDAIGIASVDALDRGRLINVPYQVNLSIEAVTLRNSWVNDVHCAGIYITVSPVKMTLKNVNMIDCHIESSNTSGYIGAFIYCPDINVIVEADNCLFQDGYTDYGYGGVMGGGDLRARNCQFINNNADSAGLFYGGKQYLNNCLARNNSGRYGNLVKATTTVVSNCVFANNVYPPPAYGAIGQAVVSWMSYNTIYYNNTVNSGSQAFWDGGTPTNNFKNSYIPTGSGALNIVNCIISNASPFVSAIVPYDLHLKGGSVCIDRGTTEGALPLDLDGASRPHGFAFDMGPYEFQGPSVSVESPNGREIVMGYSTWEVKFLVSGEAPGMNINYLVRLSTNEGITWPTVIASGSGPIPANSEIKLIWTVLPESKTTKGLISVEVTNFSGIWNSDASNGTFEVRVPDIIKPIIQIIQPNGGEKIKGGTVKYRVTCRATDERTLSQNITVETYYTTGETWIFLGLTREASTGIGTYEWTLPVITTTEARIRMVASDEAGNRATAESAATFSIDSLPPTVTVVQPNGGETLAGASKYSVTWIATDAITQSQNMSIEVYYTHGSSIWSPVGTTKGGPSALGTYEWTVPYENTTEAKIRVVVKDEVGYVATDESDLKFNISKTAPQVILVQPNGGEYIMGGNMYKITWTATDETTPFALLTSEVYYNDGSGSWTYLTTTAEGVTGIGTYEWFVPVSNTTEARIRVSTKNISGQVGTDESASTFNIDSTIPTVIQTVPLNAAINVPVDSNIEITFNDEMNAGTVVTHIYPVISLGESWNALSSEVTYVPASKFPPTQKYIVTVESGARDKAGNIMTTAYSFTFESASDITPPLVTLEAPLGGIGEWVKGGTTYEVRWTATDEYGIPAGAVTLRYSIDSGATWGGSIQSGLNNTGAYVWTIPYLKSDFCRVSVEVRDIYNNRGYAASPDDFKISSEVMPTDYPSIEGVYVNGRGLIAEDIISKKSVLSAHILDIHGIVTVEADIDNGDQIVVMTLTSGTSFDGFWSANITIPAVPERLHILRISASNEAGLSDFVTKNAWIYSGAVQVIENPMNYPNPFKPLSSNPQERSTIIQYKLNVDAATGMIIYDMTGKEVKRMKFASGQEGGRAGINSVSWNGHGLSNQPLGNGMYLYKIIYRDKSIGSGKIVIFD